MLILHEFTSLHINTFPRGPVLQYQQLPAHNRIAMSTKEKIVLSDEEHRRYRMLCKLLKSGVPEAAVEARCAKENIQSEIVLRPEAFDVLLATSVAERNHLDQNDGAGDNPLFHLNEKEVEFPANPNSKTLQNLVKTMVATIKRRGPQNLATGKGKHLSVPVNDLKNAFNSIRAVQYARNLYQSSVRDRLDPRSDEARCKRQAFLEQCRLLGVPIVEDKIEETIPGLDELILFIEKIAKIPPIPTDGHYDFDDLAQLFRPGRRCIARSAVATGVDCLVCVTWSRYEQGKTLGGIVRRFVVNFQFVACVGDCFALPEFVETLEEFESQRSIAALPFVPVLAENEDSILDPFAQRGTVYSKVVLGANFMAYSKGSFYPKQQQSSSGRSFRTASRGEGRMMVDVPGSYDAGHSVSVGYDGMVLAIQQKVKEYNVHRREQRQAAVSSASFDRSSNSKIEDGGPLFLKCIPLFLMDLTWPTLTGFSFTSKLWGDVLVEGLFPIEFTESTFDRLVLPASRKRMIKALVRHSSDSFNDIISGKGAGTVFLLYGPPGCGKTLTAESISEMLHRPLYSISIGQLGTSPETLEEKLGDILDLCQRWDSLILLDEADVFLEKRTKEGSLERNAMCSVMLRLVEYFKGVLFLTTNRVDSLDPAFKSRITLALQYEALNEEARQKVWNNLLDASGQKSQIESGAIDTKELARSELNGREIKNSICLALALAAEDEMPLSQETLLETVRLLCDFNDQLNNADAY